MDKFSNIQNVYLVGIGGIGMSALARYFLARGVQVSGYDMQESDITAALTQEGATIVYQDSLDNLDPKAELVIYTPAIKNNQMLSWYRDQGYQVHKRSEVLGLITSSSITYAVAGTHGKTTISTMLAHILYTRSQHVNAFMGGISTNYNTNYLHSDQTEECVVEADEYDKSFLQLHPFSIILTALDADHLDIYDTPEAMVSAYDQFVGMLPAEGMLISKYELAYKNPSQSAQLTYSLQNDYADIYAQDIQMREGAYKFSVVVEGESHEGFELNMGGMHNVENALAVIIHCIKIGLEIDFIKSSLAAFRGVKRRFEYVYKTQEKCYIDDYAHHPAELSSLIKSAKSLFMGRKVNIVFQPHLYTRTRDFAAEFASVLDEADNIILLDLYPAREQPIEGVNSDLILGMMHNENKHLLSKEATLEWVAATRPDLLITAGAGDISKLVPQIKSIYEQT